nr:SPOR domain-containing protein [Sphingobium sp. SYK-6]
MRSISATIILTGLLMSGAALQASVKTGVDAWNQGDYVRAVEQWRPEAIGGNADAQFNLGQAYKLGRGVPVDLPVALEWYRKAAERGHQKAADNYGLLLFQQGRREDAIAYIKASAERGEPRAQYVYGTALFNGDLAPRDWVKAYALMTSAARAGIGQATASLAEMDRYIPEAQRTEGLAMAASMASGEVSQEAPTVRPVAVAPSSRIAQASTPVPAPAAKARTDRAATMPASVQAPVRPTPAPAPQVTAASATPTPKPAKATPSPAPASVRPMPRPSASGRWRVQLGAFKEQGRAQALWASLGKKVPALSGFQPAFIAANGFTRLLVGPLDNAADARALCERIRPTGTPCMATSQ